MATIKHFKARLVVRGDLQEETDENYSSPVASWPTVRIFLVISKSKGWVTVSIDFSNAFIQSDLPEGEEIWMSIPRGFVSTKGPGYCLKLVKSVYGLKSAPQLWHNHSSEAFHHDFLVHG